MSWSRVALAASLLLAPVAHAQRDARLDVRLPPAAALGTQGPEVVASGVLGDSSLIALVRNGFNARLHYRVELWPVRGLFRNRRAVTEWDVVVVYEPLSQRYRVTRVTPAGIVAELGSFADIAGAERAVSAPYRAPITPPKNQDAYYYSAVLEVEAMNVSDLDELMQWTRGELRPAVQGRRNPGTALVLGIKTIVVRLLGGEAHRFEARTPAFTGSG